MATLSDITSADWSLSVSTQGEVVQGIEDIAQCINIILSTQRGSDPLRPEFGVDLLQYIDKPLNTAIPNIIREMIEQVNRWEPRCTIERITHEIIGDSQLKFSIEFTFASQIGTTTVTLQS